MSPIVLTLGNGWITRTNLEVPLSDLTIGSHFVNPDIGSRIPKYYFAENGINPGVATKRRQTAASMYVPGQGNLGSWPDITDATFSFTVTSSTGAGLDSAIGDLVEAVTLQMTWELHVRFGNPDNPEPAREWAWSCWDADEPQVGFTASFWVADASTPVLWAPVSVTCKRDPVLVEGPYQIA